MIYRSKEKSGNTAEEPLLLWTNPNNYFTSGTLKLNFDTTKYKYLAISVCASVEQNGREQLALLCEVDKVCIINGTYNYEYSHYFGKASFNRLIYLYNKTLTGEDVYISIAEGNDNSYNYPKRIWALTENTKLPVI